MRKASKLLKALRCWGFKESDRSYDQKFNSADNPQQDVSSNVKKLRIIKQDYIKARLKLLYLLLHKFWSKLPKTSFQEWEERGGDTAPA